MISRGRGAAGRLLRDGAPEERDASRHVGAERVAAGGGGGRGREDSGGRGGGRTAEEEKILADAERDRRSQGRMSTRRTERRPFISVVINSAYPLM